MNVKESLKQLERKIFAARRVEVEVDTKKSKWIPCMNTPALDIKVETLAFDGNAEGVKEEEEVKVRKFPCPGVEFK